MPPAKKRVRIYKKPTPKKSRRVRVRKAPVKHKARRVRVSFKDKDGKRRSFMARRKKRKYNTVKSLVAALRKQGRSEKFIANAVFVFENGFVKRKLK